MRYLVISDTHRQLQEASQIIHNIHPLIDGVIHLGDLTSDCRELAARFQDIYGLSFLGVRGNCDSFLPFTPTERCFSVESVKVYLCHGHAFHVRSDEGKAALAAHARSLGASVALFGHTHIPYYLEEKGLLLMNPGSLAQPRAGSPPSYGILEIADGRCAGIIQTY